MTPVSAGAFRVSNVCAFHRWLQDDDSDPEDLVRDIRSGEWPNEAMLKGTAFHTVLEVAKVGENIKWGKADGYTFHFVGDFNLYIPQLRETRREKDYGGIVISGQADAVEVNTIYDHKTTESPIDAERYMNGYQWRYYLDIFGSDRFVWNVWEMKAMKEPKSYCVHTLHRLEQYRYPGMEADCRDLAQEFKQFAERYL